MSSFIPFLLMIALVTLVSSSNNKKRQQKTDEARRRYMEHFPAEEADEEDEDDVFHLPVPSVPAPSAPPVTPAASAPLERAPLLRTSLSPTPHDHSDMFAGSLHADDSGEGYDPHDHGFTTTVTMPSHSSEREINASLLAEEAQPVTGGKGLLDFSGDALVRAFVMQEVLGRPGGGIG